MTIGNKISFCRKKAGISQEALAAKLSISRQAVSRWETGEVIPDTEEIIQLSRLFNVSTDYLLLDEIEEQQAKMEQKYKYKIDELLGTALYSIDFLPEPVAGGQFFDVEDYLLNSEKRFSLKDRFVNVILKLMCYYHVSIQWNGWIDRPKPQTVEEAVNTFMDNHSDWLIILLPEENALVILDGFGLFVYNPSEKMQAIMERLAFSEGLFWRKSRESLLEK